VCQYLSRRRNGRNTNEINTTSRPPASPAAKTNTKRLIHKELYSINPWGLIGFHYRDRQSNGDELLKNVPDLKRKLHRIIYQSRVKILKGAGEYPYIRMLFS